MFLAAALLFAAPRLRAQGRNEPATRDPGTTKLLLLLLLGGGDTTSPQSPSPKVWVYSGAFVKRCRREWVSVVLVVVVVRMCMQAAAIDKSQIIISNNERIRFTAMIIQ